MMRNREWRSRRIGCDSARCLVASSCHRDCAHDVRAAVHDDRVRFLVIAALIAGCGDNDTGGVPLEEWAAAARDARCAHYVTCGVIPGELDCGWADLGTFEVPPYFWDAIAFGEIRWRPDVAYECLSHAEDWSCDRTVDDPWCRERFYEGKLHDGEGCRWGGQCISGECWHGGTQTCHDTLCPGVCVGDTPLVPGRLYEGCRFSRCLEGWCDGNVCRPFAPEGGACERDEECEPGTICIGELRDERGICERLPDTGERCSGLCRWIGDTCPLHTRRCQPFKRQNEPCLASDECSPFYVCDKTLRCKPRLP